MAEKTLSVTFFVEGEKYAGRVWNHAPQVGDEVMLGNPKQAYKVLRVVWGVETPDIPRDWQAVNIELKLI